MEHQLIHQKTFRYETNDVQIPTRVLFVLHGYGQLARFFIRKFEALNSDWLIVAPEGMHRFYLNGSSGRVGASWMTKEARDTDITDNLSWLDHLKTQIDLKYGRLEAFVLGFSQGGATAARWISQSKHKFEGVCLWACVYPPDLETTILPESIRRKFFVIGTEDEFYDEQQQKQLAVYYRDIGYQVINYNGKHDINREVLNSIYG